ncbi:hypothetical protein [Streptomyces sp. enrichment culture]|uniref:hypothetical protein n=1 Tax=Streptomyces sp. enrichment culture TaxID=1795815 RepID=UPI003F56E10A
MRHRELVFDKAAGTAACRAGLAWMRQILTDWHLRAEEVRDDALLGRFFRITSLTR